MNNEYSLQSKLLQTTENERVNLKCQMLQQNEWNSANASLLNNEISQLKDQITTLESQLNNIHSAETTEHATMTDIIDNTVSTDPPHHELSVCQEIATFHLIPDQTQPLAVASIPHLETIKSMQNMHVQTDQVPSLVDVSKINDEIDKLRSERENMTKMVHETATQLQSERVLLKEQIDSIKTENSQLHSEVAKKQQACCIVM